MTRMIVFIGFFYLLWAMTPAHAGLGFMSVFLAKTHPDCSASLPAHDAKFCRTFETTARCACRASGMPISLCQDMNAMHKRMLMVFSTELAACQFQRDTDTQACMDSWKCYRSGGKDAHGHLCQTTGAACQALPKASRAEAS